MNIESSTTHTAVDKRIQETVRHRIDGCSYKFIFDNVTWHSNEGHLTLWGRVPNFYLKQVLQELLHGIEQVTQITNSVDVVSSTGISSVWSDKSN